MGVTGVEKPRRASEVEAVGVYTTLPAGSFGLSFLTKVNVGFLLATNGEDDKMLPDETVDMGDSKMLSDDGDTIC